MLDFLKQMNAENLSARDVAEASRSVSQQLPALTYGRGSSSTAGSDGSATLYEDRVTQFSEYRVGKVVNRPTGTSPGVSDFPDERYWVTIQGAGPTKFDENLKPTNDSTTEDGDSLIVHNLPEWAPNNAGTHSLPTDGSRYVIVFTWLDLDGNPRHVMDAQGGFPLLLKILDELPGGGFYEAAPASSNTGMNTAADADLTGLTLGGSVVYLNLEEQGQPTHHLRNVSDGEECYVSGFRVGQTTDVPPIPVYAGVAGRARRNASFSMPAGAMNYWDRDAATAGAVNGDSPVTLDVLTGFDMVPFLAGYQITTYANKLYFEADGRLRRIDPQVSSTFFV